MIPEATIKRIHELRAQGVPISEIAKRLEIALQTAYAYANGKQRLKVGRKALAPEMVARIRELAAQGLSYHRISKALGISDTTVKRYASGIERPKRPKRVKREKSIVPKRQLSRLRRRSATVEVMGICRVCSCEIPIGIANGSDLSLLLGAFSKLFVECPLCNTAFQANAVADVEELKRAWFESAGAEEVTESDQSLSE